MNSLQFQRLVLISDSKKLANQFEFPKRLNLITGSDNSVGKSTLVKCLFWALGCSPWFDEEWKSNDIKSILYFKIAKIEYVVSRYHEMLYFGKLGGKLKKYSKITGDYSIDFSEIVGFDLKLANRAEELITPPPSYYFLPFYIDQKKSWGAPWEAFDNLQQFADFRRTLINYFCGYIKPEHFEIEEDIFEQKIIEREANKQVERINSAIEVLEEVTEENSKTCIALSSEELKEIQSEIDTELSLFVSKQVTLFDKQTQLKSDIYDLEKQLSIALSSVKELNEDYEFAVENIPNDLFECPLCGTEHDNSLLSRAGLLVDQSLIKEEAEAISVSLIEHNKTLVKLNEELDIVRQEVIRINEKYILSDEYEDEKKDSFQNALQSLAKNNVTSNVTKVKEVHELKSKQAVDECKDLKADQKKLLPKNEKEELNTFFFGSLEENIKKLSAEGINLNGVKSPLNYKKLLGGGAAEGTRGILAYQLAVLRQIEHAKQCVLAPFVVDTPNQQEQAIHHYEKVISAIKDNVTNNFQVILCGMKNELISSFMKDANVITLTKNKLLEKDHYLKLSLEYAKVTLND